LQEDELHYELIRKNIYKKGVIKPKLGVIGKTTDRYGKYIYLSRDLTVSREGRI